MMATRRSRKTRGHDAGLKGMSSSRLTSLEHCDARLSSVSAGAFGYVQYAATWPGRMAYNIEKSDSMLQDCETAHEKRCVSRMITSSLPTRWA